MLKNTFFFFVAGVLILSVKTPETTAESAARVSAMPVEATTTVVCPVNEEYYSEPPRCLTCRAARRDDDCEIFGEKEAPRCDCKNEFLRNEQGVCIPEAKCFKCNAANQEVFYSSTNCLPTCKDAQPCRNIRFARRNPGCGCKKGWVKTEDRICVLEITCRGVNLCPRELEVWDKCPGPCTPLTCGDLPRMANCPAFYSAAPPGVPCLPRCRCEDTYVFNDDGECVAIAECLCGDPNAERVDYPNACPGGGTCVKPEYVLCDLVAANTGCQCKEGFLKDRLGKCIPQEQCKKQCGLNEVFSERAPDCPETCSNRKAKRCSTTKPGCACARGFLRKTKGGKCIQPKDC